MEFDIAPGPLGRVLTRYAIQTNRQILFTPEIVAGKRSPGLKGRLDAGTALRRLLAGSGLTFRVARGGAVIIEVAAAPARPPARATPSPPLPIESAPIEPIIVTALKRETVLEDTPMSLSVVSGASLAARDAFDVRSMGRTLLGFSSIDTGSGQQRLTVRGVYGTGEATVGVYFDETPVTAPGGTTFDPGQVAPDVELVDIARVELLRGPQGTLYGASSMGGTLRILFNQPDPAGWSGSVSGGVDLVEDGSLGGRISAVVNVPLVADTLTARGVAYRRVTGGYIDRPGLRIEDAGGVTREGGRLALAWRPRADMDVTLTGLLHHGRTDDATFWLPALGRYRNDQPTRTPNSNALALLNGVGHWNMGFATLTTTASRYRWRVTRQTDYTGVLARQETNPDSCQRYNDLPDGAACSSAELAGFVGYAESRLPATLYQPMVVTSANAEIRLSSANGSRTDWTVGGFVERRKDRVDSFALHADPATGLVHEPFDITGLRTIWSTLTQQALFGDVTRHFTSSLSATAGMRYFHYHRTARGDVTIPNVLTGTANLASAPYGSRERGSNLKFQLAWRASPDALFYTQAAEGFRPGGVNITPNLTDQERVYHADRLWSYEVGSKLRLANSALSADLAAFHIDWSDMIYVASSANGAFAYNTNIGPVEIDGGEAQINMVVAPRTRILVQMSYVDARLAADQARPSPGGAGRKGDPLPNVPHLSGSVSAIGAAPLGHGLLGSVRVDVAATGPTVSQFNPSITYFERSPGYMVVDGQLGLERGSWQASIAIRNLFDAAEAGRILSNTFVTREIYSVPPRTISLGFSRSF